MLLKIAFAASAGLYSREAHGPGIAPPAAMSAATMRTGGISPRGPCARLVALTSAPSAASLIRSNRRVKNTVRLALMTLYVRRTGQHPAHGTSRTKTPIIRQKTQSVTQKERQTRNLSEKRSGLTEKRGGKAKNHRVDINRARPAAKGRSFGLQIIFTVETQYSTQTLATSTKSLTKVLNLRIFLIEQKITENDINQLCRNRLM